LPGTLRRSEAGLPVSDLDVNAVHDNTGDVFQFYWRWWNRDSYNNAGAAINSTVHYGLNYCNAFWNGTQMVYGDGNASQGCFPLSRSVDVTAHELTHAVTEYESNLVYAGEAGGLNESLSDVWGAGVEAYVLGGRNGTLSLDPRVFLIGDAALPPFLRDMCDPAADGVSRDEWTSSLKDVDVSYSSGPNNLVFCLLTKGGVHPRGKTAIQVPAIGMEKTLRLMYKANVDILTSSSNYAAMRAAMSLAAQQLGYSQEVVDAVNCAYAAINVGVAPPVCAGPFPEPWIVSDLADATIGSFKYWTFDVPANQSKVTFKISGGTGDADLYVNFGSAPSEAVYQCRPYLTGNNETCTFSPPSVGTYFVGLRTYAPYSGLTLKGVAGPLPDPWIAPP
jgi:vibriolysin